MNVLLSPPMISSREQLGPCIGYLSQGMESLFLSSGGAA